MHSVYDIDRVELCELRMRVSHVSANYINRRVVWPWVAVDAITYIFMPSEAYSTFDAAVGLRLDSTETFVHLEFIRAMCRRIYGPIKRTYHVFSFLIYLCQTVSYSDFLF